jgi:uncharacterized membrane protein HdeD (DUF308 family)
MTEPPARPGSTGPDDSSQSAGQMGSEPASPGDASSGTTAGVSDTDRTGRGPAPPPSRPGAAGSHGGRATATRTPASHATVPEQGRKQERDRLGRYARQDDGSGDTMISRTLGNAWGAVLFGGLLLIAAGVALVAWPSAALTVVAILIGAAVLVSGLVKLFEGFTASSESGGMRAGYIVVGVLAVLAGIYLIRHHALSLFLIAFVTGVYFIVHGVIDIGVATTPKNPSRGLRAVLGVLSIAAGIIIVVWPSPSLTVLVLIVGAWLLLYGLVICGLAFSIRQAAKTAGSAGTGTARPAVHVRWPIQLSAPSKAGQPKPAAARTGRKPQARGDSDQ